MATCASSLSIYILDCTKDALFLLPILLFVASAGIGIAISFVFIISPHTAGYLESTDPTMAFIFKKRSKTKTKGSGGKKKYRWGKKKGGSKFASTELPVIEEEDQEREKDADNDGIFDGTVATEDRDDVLDFGDISRTSTDDNGDEFILNSYNTDGTIDGSQLKSDAEVPIVEDTSFSQQLAVAAVDAANMFQRMSSMSVVPVSIPIQTEEKDNEEKDTTRKDGVGDKLVKGVDGDTEDIEGNTPKDKAKQEDQTEEDTLNEAKEEGGDDATKDASSDDVDKVKVESDSDANKITNEVDSSGTGATAPADNAGVIAEKEDAEEDESPFNVCTDLFRF